MPLVSLIAVLGLGAAALLYLSRDLTFYQDTWSILMHRQDPALEDFLRPHNEHIVLLPVVITTVFVNVFGMDSALPEYIVLTSFNVGISALLFYYVSRRMGSWIGVIVAGFFLSFGPGWSVLLWTFQIGFAGALFFGLAALIALERANRAADRLAVVFLAISIAFSTLGLVFLTSACVLLALRRPRDLTRAYVVVLPILLFGLWYVGWGSSAENSVSLSNLVGLYEYLLTGLAFSSERLVGLDQTAIAAPPQLIWGPAVLLALVAFVIYNHRRCGQRFSVSLWPAVAALLAFWLLAGVNYIPGREPGADRYAFQGAILLVLVLANLFPGWRPQGPQIAAVGAVALLAAAANATTLQNAREFLHEQTLLTRAGVGAIEISAATVAPDFTLTPEIAGTPSLIDINAESLLQAASEHGSPGFDPRELEAAPELARRQADLVLMNALPITWQTRRLNLLRKARMNGDCQRMPSRSGADGGLIPLMTRELLIAAAPGPPSQLFLRRFAKSGFPVQTGIPGGQIRSVLIPADGAARRWQARVDTRQGVELCALP